VGMHQVANRATFAKKLGIAHDVELGAVTIIPLDRFRDFFPGFYRHRAFINDDAIIGQNAGDFARDFFDEAKIDMSTRLLWSRHGDENNLRVIDRFLDAAGKSQAMRGNVAMNYFLQARFVDWNLASL